MRAPDPYLGREIANGKYKILQQIGRGGMGTVYKASQPTIGRMVAIKILHPKLTNRKDLVTRFSREAKALGHLSHPNTVKVFDDGVLEDGSLFIVMEFLEGKNLNQIIRSEGRLPLERGLPVLIQICGALEEAHQRGVVHRDLKPENIFLCSQGGIRDFPKVLDFGLAKLTDPEMRPGATALTQEGMVFGTPEFMSPEQAQGKTLDARSDVYSLAVILYEALTGKLPFDSRSPMEFVKLHVQATPIRIDQRVPGLNLPAALADVMAKALEKDPDNRYQSAKAFSDALETIVPKSSGPQSQAAPGSAMAPSSPASATRPGIPLGVLIGVGVVCLLLGIGATALIMLFVIKR